MAFPIFTTHTDGTSEVIAAAHMNSVQTAATTLNVYDLSLSAEAVMANSEVMIRWVAPRALTIPANLAGSSGSATVSPTGSTALTIRRRASGSQTYTTVGTITFPTGTWPVAATLSTQVATNFVTGDELSVLGPATADATLASWSFTLVLVNT